MSIPTPGGSGVGAEGPGSYVDDPARPQRVRLWERGVPGPPRDDLGGSGRHRASSYFFFGAALAGAFAAVLAAGLAAVFFAAGTTVPFPGRTAGRVTNPRNYMHAYEHNHRDPMRVDTGLHALVT